MRLYVMITCALCGLAFIPSNTFSQKGIDNIPKSNHEVSLQPIGFFSYSYIRNFNPGLSIGVKTGIGAGIQYRLEQINEWHLTSLQIGFYVRDLFLKQSERINFTYNLGLFSSTDILFNGEEQNKRFGVNAIISYNIGDFKFGPSIQVSAESIFTEDRHEFPKIEIIPIVISYKF
ncbi:MAG: hypothetical protein K9G76_10055 [Bacteroidales bacterium]|nr:hypothetical protein [Bacteroidales bacterium]MCF8404043.1 hypothetical protein [Bacteroidales bacterium]